MRNLSKTFFLICFALIYLTSCKTISVDRPPETYLPSKILPVTSEFPLQIEIDIPSLQSAVNRATSGLLFETNRLNHQDIAVKVWKAEDFSFNVKNNVIEYRVPLRLWTRFGWSLERFGLRLQDQYEAQGSLALRFTTSFEIDNQWQLKATTTSAGFQWIEVPRVNVMGITVPITPVANFAIQQSQQLITSQLDKFLSETVTLKQYAETAWIELQNPILLDPSHALWLRIIPHTIHTTPITTNDNKLLINLNLNAQVETSVGTKPILSNIVPLPPLKISDQLSTNFKINLAADAPFEKISELAGSQLIHQTFREGRNHITIEGLSIFGSGNKAVLQLDVKGTINGSLFLMGDVVYNAQKMTLELQNPEFDIRTKNALAKSARWLLNGLIIRRITPYLTYSVQTDLAQLKAEANRFLAHYTLYEGISLHGKLNRLTVQSLHLVPGAVRIKAGLEGNLRMRINEIQW